MGDDDDDDRYINVRESRDARLAFEALRLLASLFCHKKFTLDWVARGGLALLLQLPRPSMAATGSSLCLYYLACDDDTMERVCTMAHSEPVSRVDIFSVFISGPL